MADVDISVGANTKDAEATLEQLKGIVSELFKGINVDSEKSAAIQEQLTAAWKEQNVTLLQANDAAAALRPEVESLATAQTTASTATSAHAFNVKDLSKSLLGTISVVGLVKSNFDALKPSLSAAGSELRSIAVAAGLSNDSASILTNTFEMMANPFTIIENLTANLKISSRLLAEALYDEASAADAATEAQQRKAGVMASVLSEQQKLVAEEQKGAESLDRRTAALERQIQAEQQGGEVKKFYLDKLRAILDEYDRRGETPPQKTLELAQALGVLSSEQEKAATASEKHSASVREETTAVADSGAAYDGVIGKLKEFAEGKDAATKASADSLAALKAETEALKEQADAANEAAKEAGKSASDAQKRIKELESEPVLTIDQQNELNSLKEQQVNLDLQAGDAAAEAADKTFEYGQAQDLLAGSTAGATGALEEQASGVDHAAGVMAELDSATREYQQAIDAAADSSASASKIIETVGENGERKFTNLADAAGEFGDVLVEVGEDGTKSITNAANAADKIPTALDKIGPAAEKAGEGLAALDEGLSGKDGDGISKAASDLETVEGKMQSIATLAREIRVEFQRINGAISGAGTGT